MGEGVAGIWEEDRNPEFLRGVGAERGGGEPGAGCLGTEQEAGFLVSPPTGPAHPCQLPPVLFSHPNCWLDFSCPRGAERLGKAPPAALEQLFFLRSRTGPHWWPGLGMRGHFCRCCYFCLCVCAHLKIQTKEWGPERVEIV